MAYVVDLEDEYADADVPTTIVRSKADTHIKNEINTGKKSASVHIQIQ
jgi:hypothetical protein